MTEVTVSGAVLPRRTERLLLRPLRHTATSPTCSPTAAVPMIRYMPAEPLRPSDARDFVAERIPAVQIKTDDNKIILAVEHEGRVIGDLLVKAGQMADRQAEIGWAFNPDFYGRGFAREAARELLVLAFADLGMHRVFAQLDPRNAASARLCERLGMRRGPLLPRGHLVQGRVGRHHRRVRALAADWRRSPRAG
jgi:aminoglycoside 6'-N-acetyltransferase